LSIGAHWIFGVMIVFLVGLNTLFWGFALKEVGDPSFSLGFFIRLTLNKWFVLAIGSGFTVTLLSYWVYSALGVMMGRLFLSMSIASVLFVGTILLGERASITQWIGVIIVIIGSLLIGRG